MGECAGASLFEFVEPKLIVRLDSFRSDAINALRIWVQQVKEQLVLGAGMGRAGPELTCRSEWRRQRRGGSRVSSAGRGS